MMRFVLYFFFSLMVSSAYAEVPWKPMLQGLMQRQYYDVAIDFLQSLEHAAKCPSDLKNQVDLQIATVHLEALSQGNAPLGFDVHFTQAKNALTRFLKEHSDSEEAYLANRNLGKLHLEELRQLTLRIHSPETTAPQKEVFRNLAEEKYTEVEILFQRAERIVTNTARLLRDHPETKNDSARVMKRDAAFMQVLEARVQLAALPREHAHIYDRGSIEFRRSMEEAAFLCNEIVLKYADYVGSLDAKLVEAKSYCDLDNNKQARVLVKELNVLSPTTPQFRAILAEAFPLMLELNLKEPTPENLADSLERILRWTNSTTLAQRSDPFYAKANLLAGRTYLKLGQSEKALPYLNAVPVWSPESQEALQLLASHKGNSTNSVTPGELLEIPATFTDAIQQAERKFQDFLLAERVFSMATDPREKTLRETSRNQLAEQTISAFRAALGFVESDRNPGDISDLCTMRIKLATVNWSLDRWEDVIVIGDYLMKHYAATSFGPQGGDLAIKATRRLFLEDSDPATLKRFEKTYDTIVARWETFPIGQEAISLRIETELDLGSLDQAKKFLDTIPADSDRRATAEQKFGCALWALYVNDTSNESLLSESRQYLEQGLASQRDKIQTGAPIDITAVSACLVLAQIELVQKNPRAAQAFLDDPDFGPLLLFDRQRQQTGTSPIFDLPDWNETFKSQILTVAIRIAQDARQHDQVKTLLESFDARKADADEKTLLWLADTYYRLGTDVMESFAAQTTAIEPIEPPEQAVAYFEQAESLYRKVEERARQADALLRFKLALAKRGQGKYGDAYEILAELIRESEKRLNVQIEAARTLQLWGKSDKSLYYKAIVGDLKKPDGNYEIWGWKGIIRETSRNLEKSKTEYFEAHYNKTVCRILLARESSDSDAKTLLDGAKNELNLLRQLHPNFGGEPWTTRFAQLIE